MDTNFDDYQDIQNKQGEGIKFVKFIAPDWILSWKEEADNEWGNSGKKSWNCYGERATNIPIEDLKKTNVWDQLSVKIRGEIEGLEVAYQEVKQGRIDKMQAGRRKKYLGVPSELTCIQCHNKIPIAPRITAKKVEKIALEKGITYTLDIYIKEFKCRKCEPAIKGRKSTGKCIPLDLVCKCGTKVTYPTNVIQKMADKKGKTLEGFVKTWECRKCRPKISPEKQFGGKRGRKANPEFIGLSKKMICKKCGAETTSNFTQLKKKAKKNDTTIQELIKNYKCSKCSGRKRGRPRND